MVATGVAGIVPGRGQERRKKYMWAICTWVGGVGCVVWCGVVWCGVVWCGVVWCGVCVSDVKFEITNIYVRKNSRYRAGKCPPCPPPRNPMVVTVITHQVIILLTPPVDNLLSCVPLPFSFHSLLCLALLVGLSNLL